MKNGKKYRLATIACLTLMLQSLQPSSARETTEESDEVKVILACTNWLSSRSIDDAPRFKAISDQLACYDGMVDGVEGKKLTNWLSSRKALERQSLVVRSRGGPVDAGLLMGKAILEAGAKVFISEVCGSSCANYIFSPAEYRYVLPNSLVLFHGGISNYLIDRGLALAKKEIGSVQPDPVKANANLVKIREGFIDQLTQQRQLMAKAGVTADFFERYETHDLKSLAEDQCTPGRNRNFVFLSQTQFEKIGIRPLGEVVKSVDQAAGILANLNTDLGETAVCIAPDELIQEGLND